jgi:hypothetical protein
MKRFLDGHDHDMSILCNATQREAKRTLAAISKTEEENKNIEAFHDKAEALRRH